MGHPVPTTGNSVPITGLQLRSIQQHARSPDRFRYVTRITRRTRCITSGFSWTRTCIGREVKDRCFFLRTRDGESVDFKVATICATCASTAKTRSEERRVGKEGKHEWYAKQ